MKIPFLREKRPLSSDAVWGTAREELSRRGFAVTAFDLSPTAIEWCRRRYPLSKVRYEVADLLKAPAGWNQFYDFVFEGYTLQSHQPPFREELVKALPRFLAPHGFLLVVSRAKEPNEFPEGPPWPLTKNDFTPFLHAGLQCGLFEDFKDKEQPPIRRFLALYRA